MATAVAVVPGVVVKSVEEGRKVNFTPEEYAKMAEYAQQLLEDRDQAKRKKGCCLSPGCGKRLSEDETDHCAACVKRIADCVTCGDKSSEFRCGYCYQKFRDKTCEECLRPIPGGNTVCAKCKGTMSADKFGSAPAVFLAEAHGTQVNTGAGIVGQIGQASMMEK